MRCIECCAGNGLPPNLLGFPRSTGNRRQAWLESETSTTMGDLVDKPYPKADNDPGIFDGTLLTPSLVMHPEGGLASSSAGVGVQDEAPAAAFVAAVRTELAPPVAYLLDALNLLVEKSADAGRASYFADLSRARDAAGRLSVRIRDLSEGPATGSPISIRDLRHDLRTPIAAVIGYAELVAEDAQDRGDAALVQSLTEILSVSAGLLNDLDTFASMRPATSSAQPVDDGPAQPPAWPGADESAAPQIARKGKVVGRILIVDDNESMRDLLSRRLVREGHTVELCDSGRAALGLYANRTFDLMLLDLMMPGMSGLDVLHEIGTRDGERTLPVIVVSAFDEVEAAVQCIGAGADDFLTKPFDETLLRARITSSLERKFLRDREAVALEQLKIEQKRSETLLRNVLPAGVVERLRLGETTIADQFEDATVLFCDMVGFTALSASLGPHETLTLLNDIFSAFDTVADSYGLEKIKTIGDAYMLVGGISEPEKDHARRVVSMAAGLPAIVDRIAGRHALSLRIGIDTGPVVAGIIGRRKFFYDVWGDTVNTASRLEQSSEPGRIHLSDATRLAAGKGFRFADRPPMALRGKGVMQTFFLEA